MSTSRAIQVMLLLLLSGLAASGAEKQPELRFRHGSEVNAVAFSPDSKTLASGGSDGTVRLWEVATGKPLSQLAGGDAAVQVVAFAPDGRTLLAGDRRGRLRLWDLPLTPNPSPPRGEGRKDAPSPPTPLPRSGGEGRKRVTLDQDRAVIAAAFSPDGQTLASCSWYDRIIHLRDLPGGANRRLLVGDDDPGSSFTALHFTAGGRLLACPLSNQLMVWDVATGARRRVVPGERRRASLYHASAFSPSGRLWAAASVEHHAGMWDVLTGKQLLETRLVETARRSWAVAFSADGGLLALGGGDREGVLQLCDTVACKEVRTLQGFSAAVRALAFSPDGRRLATAAADGTVLVWDAAALAPRRPASAGRDDVERLWLALADADGHRAMAALAASRGAVPFLQQRLRPSVGASPAQLARLVTELDDERFEVRERAVQELGRLGQSAVAVLRKTLAGKPSLEVRRRAEQLLAELDGPGPAPEEVRMLRAVDALERMGTPEARKLLEKLATGARGASLTEEARAALQRLARRTHH